LPQILAKNRFDIFHSPVAAIPLFGSFAKIATIHEIPWREPGTRGDEGRRFRHRAWVYLASQYARHIICPSRHTAHHLSSLYPAAKNKIHVIPHLIGREYCRESAAPPPAFDFLFAGKPYFLCVGRAREKKNWRQALQALRWIGDENGMDIQLVIVGPRGKSLQKIRQVAQKWQLDNRVHILGYVEEQLLQKLYRRAVALLYLSYSEGFGLPPLEAMALQTPVIASDRGAIPEICGKGAWLVDPDQPEGIARAMLQMLEDEGLAQQYVGKGAEQVTTYSWENIVKAVLSLYK